MPRRKLTNVSLEKLKPGPELTDADSGLRVKVRPTGKVVFSLRYRRPTTRKGAKLTVGFWDAQGLENDEPVLGGPLTLAQARLLCSQARRDLARGTDPGIVKREAKHAERLKVADTFEAVAREFVIRHGKNGNHRRWRGQAGSLGLIVNKKTDELLPEPKKDSLVALWRHTPVSAITKRDIQRITDAKIDKGNPYAALSTFKVLRRFFRWTVERGILEASPLQGVKAPHKGESRDRLLDDHEIRALWKACETQGAFGALVKLLLLTGCRRDECRGMRRTEVDGITWTIPKERVKGKQPHVVYLSKEAQALVAGLPVILVGDKPSTLVFTGDGKKIISGLAKRKRALDKVMAIDLPWRLHDLRRTFASNCQKLGIRFEVTEACLGHVGVSKSGVAGIYQRHDWGPEKKVAWQSWADRLAAIVENRQVPDNVVALASRP